MDLLPFSHLLIDQFKCPKCGTKNTAKVNMAMKTETSPECLYVACRACGYYVTTKTKDAE